MRNGILIPAAVVRLTTGVLVCTALAAVAAELPEIWRYVKMKTM